MGNQDGAVLTRRQKVQLVAFLIVAAVGGFFTLRNETTREAAEQANANTCSQGNFAACVRVCDQLEQISDLRCIGGSPVSKHETRGVDAGGGDNSPSGQPTPPGQQPGGGQDTVVDTPEDVDLDAPAVNGVHACRPHISVNC